jgi:hypothetical protein
MTVYAKNSMMSHTVSSTTAAVAYEYAVFQFSSHLSQSFWSVAALDDAAKERAQPRSPTARLYDGTPDDVDATTSRMHDTCAEGAAAAQ